MSKVILDARNLLCPLPVIRVQDQVRNLKPGTVLHVVCTDPGVLNDIPSWCRLNGHKVMHARTEANDYVVVLEVGSHE